MIIPLVAVLGCTRAEYELIIDSVATIRATWTAGSRKRPPTITDCACLGPLEFFGVEEILNDTVRTATAICHTPCEVYVVHKEHFLLHIKGAMLDDLMLLVQQQAKFRAQVVIQQRRVRETKYGEKQRPKLLSEKKENQPYRPSRPSSPPSVTTLSAHHHRPSSLHIAPSRSQQYQLELLASDPTLASATASSSSSAPSTFRSRPQSAPHPPTDHPLALIQYDGDTYIPPVPSAPTTDASAVVPLALPTTSISASRDPSFLLIPTITPIEPTLSIPSSLGDGFIYGTQGSGAHAGTWSRTGKWMSTAKGFRNEWQRHRSRVISSVDDRSRSLERLTKEKPFDDPALINPWLYKPSLYDSALSDPAIVKLTDGLGLPQPKAINARPAHIVTETCVGGVTHDTTQHPLHDATPIQHGVTSWQSQSSIPVRQSRRRSHSFIPPHLQHTFLIPPSASNIPPISQPTRTTPPAATSTADDIFQLTAVNADEQLSATIPRPTPSSDTPIRIHHDSTASRPQSAHLPSSPPHASRPRPYSAHASGSQLVLYTDPHGQLVHVDHSTQPSVPATIIPTRRMQNAREYAQQEKRKYVEKLQSSRAGLSLTAKLLVRYKEVLTAQADAQHHSSYLADKNINTVKRRPQSAGAISSTAFGSSSSARATARVPRPPSASATLTPTSIASRPVPRHRSSVNGHGLSIHHHRRTLSNYRNRAHEYTIPYKTQVQRHGVVAHRPQPGPIQPTRARIRPFSASAIPIHTVLHSRARTERFRKLGHYQMIPSHKHNDEHDVDAQHQQDDDHDNEEIERQRAMALYQAEWLEMQNTGLVTSTSRPASAPMGRTHVPVNVVHQHHNMSHDDDDDPDPDDDNDHVDVDAMLSDVSGRSSRHELDRDDRQDHSSSHDHLHHAHQQTEHSPLNGIDDHHHHDHDHDQQHHTDTKNDDQEYESPPQDFYQSQLASGCMSPLNPQSIPEAASVDLSAALARVHSRADVHDGDDDDDDDVGEI